MNILFVTSNRLGDAVLSTGLLSHLLEKYPGARVTVACGSLPAPLFARAPGVERVIPMVKRRHALHWLSLWAGCVGRFWDLVVDLRGSALAWCLLARSRRVLRSNRWAAKIHQVQRLGAVLGLDPPPAPTLWFAPDDEAAAARAIPPGPPVVALAPTAGWLPKVWPAERFAALAQNLAAADGILPGARFAVFGAQDERGMADPVIAALPAGRVIDLVGKVDLPTVAACLRRAAFYVGNDSGLTHMAAAVGTPTLGLFGPSPAYLYAPWGPNAAVAATAVPFEQLLGAAGFDHHDTGNLMDTLTVETAEATARELWRRCAGRAA